MILLIYISTEIYVLSIFNINISTTLKYLDFIDIDRLNHHQMDDNINSY